MEEERVMSIEILDIKENSIVFRTCLIGGVAWVPKSMKKYAEKIAKSVGRNIVLLEGNEKRTIFIVDKPFDCDEAEELQKKYIGVDEQ